MALGIGAIIGAGIFVLTGQAAAQLRRARHRLLVHPGRNRLRLRRTLLRRVRGDDSDRRHRAYTYGYATLGEFIAWIIGWDLILEYLFAASTVAVGWSGYFVSFLKDLGIIIPPQFTSAPYTTCRPDRRGHQRVAALHARDGRAPARCSTCPPCSSSRVITILLIIGISESAGFNNVIVIIKLTVVFLFIGFGLAYINRENWDPFIPPQDGPGQVRLGRQSCAAPA